MVANQVHQVPVNRGRAGVPPIDLKRAVLLGQIPRPRTLPAEVERNDLPRAEPGVDARAICDGAGRRKVVLLMHCGEGTFRGQCVFPDLPARRAIEGRHEKHRASRERSGPRFARARPRQPPARHRFETTAVRCEPPRVRAATSRTPGRPIRSARTRLRPGSGPSTRRHSCRSIRPAVPFPVTHHWRTGPRQCGQSAACIVPVSTIRTISNLRLDTPSPYQSPPSIETDTDRARDQKGRIEHARSLPGDRVPRRRWAVRGLEAGNTGCPLVRRWPISDRPGSRRLQTGVGLECAHRWLSTSNRSSGRIWRLMISRGPSRMPKRLVQ